MLRCPCTARRCASSLANAWQERISIEVDQLVRFCSGGGFRNRLLVSVSAWMPLAAILRWLGRWGWDSCLAVTVQPQVRASVRFGCPVSSSLWGWVPVVEVGLVVGYLVAWAARKAGRVAKRADAEVDAALDAGLDRVHELIAGRLGTDSAVVTLQTEAAESGQVSQRTRQWVELAVAEEVDHDEQFGQALAAVVAELAAAGGTRAAGIDLRGAKGVQVGNQNTQTNTFN
jgi:hypothetical protein